jgi:hypothetical protein
MEEEMILDIFVWGLIIILVPLIGWAADEDHWGWAVFVTILGSIGLARWQGTHPLDWSMANWQTLLKYVAGYLIVGTGFAMAKFYRKASKLKSRDLTMETHVFDSLFKNVPVWIAFWVYVLIWDIASDYLKSFFEWIADINKWIFKRIFEAATKNILAEK